ncbi:MAG: recombinase family protein [Clostridia bacterium]|nr:recombinase family protein [Clostridia bacterium]
MEQYCIYLRKSRADLEAEAHGEGETLARHEKILLELAKKQGLNVTQIYREIVSGETLAARPVMLRLLDEVEQGLWAGVLVVEIERLARGETIDQGIVAQAFKYSNTRIITPLKNFDPSNEFDEEYFEFGLFMSRREYRTINRRLVRGREAASKEGRWVSGATPYGYERVRVEGGKGWTLAVVPEQAEVVRYIFSLYTEGLRLPDGSVMDVGTSRIRIILEDMGVPSPSGGKSWFKHTISRILANPVYIGKVRWGCRRTKRGKVDGSVKPKRYFTDESTWIVVDGLHPPIVEPAVFEKAAAKLKISGATSVPFENALKNPFAGIAKCEKCGRTLVLNAQRKPALHCPSRFCDNVGVGLQLFEDKVMQALRDWVDVYELTVASGDDTESSAAQKTFLNSEIRKNKKALQTLNAQILKTHDLLEQGVYNTDTFLERSRILSQKIEEEEKRAADLAAALSALEVQETNRAAIVPQFKTILAVYSELQTPAEKNALLKKSLLSVFYRRDSRKGPKDNFEITLLPNLPSGYPKG